MRIRITTKGWDSFNGVMAGIKFEDGVSTVDVPPRVRARIGAAVRIEDVDAAGVQVGPAQDVIDSATIKAPVLIELERAKIVDEAAAARAAAEAERQAQEAKAEAEALESAKEKGEAEGFTVYSKTELEAVGHSGGIGELRKIADPLGVKGRAIDELVKAILAEQDKRVAAATTTPSA